MWVGDKRQKYKKKEKDLMITPNSNYKVHRFFKESLGGKIGKNGKKNKKIQLRKKIWETEVKL